MAYCAACGPVQANHQALWFSSTGDTLALLLPIQSIPFFEFLSRVGDVIASAIGHWAFYLAKAVGLITLTDDITTACSDRSKLLWLEAKKRGIEMNQVLFLKKPTDTFAVKKGNKIEFFKSLPFPSIVVDVLRMDDKIWFKKMMRKAGLPVPQSYTAADMSSAMKALDAVTIACVKPRSGSNGRHTYPYVKTREDMEEALTSVKDICAFASVEEQLEGNLCRATCIAGTMRGFLESYYPTVTGDGVATITELIARTNAAKPEGVSDIKIDSSHIGYLRRRGYTLESVLPEGTRLPLTYRAGSSLGGSNREHGRSIHPSFIEPIERAATLTGLSIVGFDLIIPDPFKPADEQKWGFIEANSLPWIDLHADPFYGEPIDLSPFVWDQWQRP